MASPSYTTDLTDVTTAESTSGWAELSGHTGGGSPTQESDYYIQGSYCVSQSTGNKTGTQCGLQYDNGSNITLNTGDCFFVWQVFLAANAVNTFANGGLRFGVGSTSGNMNYWKVGGSDFGRYPYGGWQNFAVDPTYTADYTDGSPTGNYRVFGSLPNIVSSVQKGNPHGVDAIRYGRGEIKIEYGDSSNGYGTFSGIAAQNDSQSNRWGLFQKQGTGYLWKGLLSFGTSSHACDFRDSNTSITIDNTPRTYSSFNKIEINNSSSRVDWTNVTFTALSSSQLSKGQLEVVDNADVNLDSCIFIDMSTFIFQSNSTLQDSTFLRCGQITQGGATFDGCTISGSTASVSILASDVEQISNCLFESDGSNHAIELNSSHAGNSYTITNCSYSGYASSDGSTGNECIYNNSGGAVTLNIVGGDTPSIRNGTGASTTLVINPVTTTVYVKTADASPVPISGARVLVTADSGGDLPYKDSVTIANSGTTATVTHTAHGMKTNDKVEILGASIQDNNGVHTITVTNANTYTYTLSSSQSSDPTGTITATWAALSGTTDANGKITASRSFNNNQPIRGRVRKSTTSPYYKPVEFIGTIDKSNGFEITVQMVKDE